MTGQLPKDPKFQMMEKGEAGAAVMLPSPEKAFDAPWHAEVFALAVHLNEGGYFDWPEWASRFGENLAAAKTVKTGVGEGLDESELALWVNRNAMIGTGLPQPPAKT